MFPLLCPHRYGFIGFATSKIRVCNLVHKFGVAKEDYRMRWSCNAEWNVCAHVGCVTQSSSCACVESIKQNRNCAR